MTEENKLPLGDGEPAEQTALAPVPDEQPNQTTAIMIVSELDNEFKIQILPDKFKAMLAEVKEVSDLQTDIIDVIAYAKALVIEDDETMRAATEKGKLAQKFSTRADESLKPIKQYIDQLKKVPLDMGKDFEASADEAKKLLADKIDVYADAKAEKERIAEVARIKAVQKAKDQRLKRINLQLDKLRAKSAPLTEKQAELEALLNKPGTTDEEAEILRTAITGIEAQIENALNKAAGLAEKTEQAAEPVPPPPPPVAEPEKVKGTTVREKKIVTVINANALIGATYVGSAELCPACVKAIAKKHQIIPLTCVKFAQGELNKAAGMGIKLPGCSVTTDKKRSFSGR